MNIEDEEEDEQQQQQRQQKKPPSQALKDIARLFSWDGRQKQAARRLWRIISLKNRGESTATIHEARKYVLRLSKELICQDVCHQPFESGLIHFLAALGVNPDTLRLHIAPEYSSLLSSLVYCVRLLAAEAFLPCEKRSKQGAAETRLLLQ
jgi:hypothetical protein